MDEEEIVSGVEILKANVQTSVLQNFTQCEVSENVKFAGNFSLRSKNFLQEYCLKQIFHIKNWILLPEHEIYSEKKFTELDETKLRDDLDEKLTRIKSVNFS